MKRHVIYRAFDIDGKLLYLGRSVNFLARLQSHSAAKNSRWLDRATTITIEKIDRRKFDPVAYEVYLISKEKPRANRMRPKIGNLSIKCAYIGRHRKWT